MEVKKEPVTPILEQLKEYAETRIKLAKYQAIEAGTSFVAGILADIMLLVSVLIAFIFFSFTVAFLLAELLHSYWGGFGCVTLLYIIIALVIKYKKGSIEKPIVNLFIQKFFKS